MCEVMAALGASEYQALINNRRLFDALLEGCGISNEAKQKHVLRVIDKLAKVGEHNVRLELGPGRIDESGDPIPGVRLESSTIDRVLAFIAARAETRSETVNLIANSLPESEAAQAALAEMTELADALDALGVDEQRARFDPSLARGLDYYTGPVFEMVIPSAPQFGSLMGGGRYNQLVERFSDRAIPCTGMSVGLDRLIAALTHLGVTQSEQTTVDALVVTLGKLPASEALRVAAELRAAGIRTEVYFGKKNRLGDQLSHADRYAIPVAVILGEDELARGEVSIKDLAKGKDARTDIGDREEYRKAGKTAQITVPRERLIEHVSALLRAGNGS